jgi:pimeloyl-ACP methyl ester carboxylesterase
MATFVLVHPAWFGGWCWKKVTPLLEVAGHMVRTPTCTGLGERSHLVSREVCLETHIQDIVSVLEYEDLAEVILVGNSSGGVVITGVADRAAERISQVVYLDAFVPADSEGVIDLIAPERRSAMEGLVQSEGDGWLLPRFAPPPWEQIFANAWGITDPADVAWLLPRLSPTPFRHFTDPVRLRGTGGDFRRVYVRCLAFPHAGFDRSAAHARDDPGWTLHELDTSHVPYVTDPEKLAALLLTSSTA